MELKDLLQLDAGSAIDWIIDNWDEYELKRKQAHPEHAEGSSLGDIEEVIKLIRAIRDLHPDGVPMRDKLGNAIRCLNQFKKANPTHPMTGEGEGR